MRSGTITNINSTRGMIGILTQDDAYTIIEMLSEDDFEVGDQLTWEDDYELGEACYRNLSKGFSAHVFVQNHGVHPTQLHQQLLF